MYIKVHWIAIYSRICVIIIHSESKYCISFYDEAYTHLNGIAQTKQTIAERDHLPLPINRPAMVQGKLKTNKCHNNRIIKQLTSIKLDAIHFFLLLLLLFCWLNSSSSSSLVIEAMNIFKLSCSQTLNFGLL